MIVTVFLLLPMHAVGDATSPPLKRVIRVGGGDDFVPYQFNDTDGRPKGYSVELMQAVARQVGLEADITLGPWHETLEELEDKKIDALIGLVYSKDRDEKFDFSVAHSIISWTIFVRTGEPYHAVDDLKNKEVIVLQDVYAHEWLRTNHLTSNINSVEDPRELLQLLSSGKYDFTVLPRLEGLELIRQLGLKNLKTIGPPVLTQKACFAVADGNADLLAQLNKGLVLFQKTGEYDKLLLKWFSLYEQKKHYWRYGLYIGSIFFGVISIVVVWNVALKKSVARKTKALQQSQSLLNQIVHGLPMPTFVVDRSNNITHWNKACESLTGVGAAQVLGTSKHNNVFFGERRLPLSQPILEKYSGVTLSACQSPTLVDGACEMEFQFQREGRQSKWLYGTAAALRAPDDEVIGAIESWQDISEYKRMEAQFIQAQKMEALGTLASGIAHDFNNLLMGIQGSTSLMSFDLEHSHPSSKHIKSIEECVHSATGLTKQLLDFARGEEYEVKPININKLVRNSVSMFSRTRKEINIHTKIPQSPLLVEADQGQIEQVLLNLYVNAWHAMPHGGELYLETSTVVMDDNDCKPYDAKPGRYAKVSVTDTGIGMNDYTRRRIFDPFFTTKEKDRGTGLGLASAYGIIKNHGGIITVYSECNHGTTFNIYLQVSGKEIHQEIAMEEVMIEGSETILLVDDEDIFLDVGQAMLKKLGYHIVVSKSGSDAIEKIKVLGNQIDLVILDLIMPGMDGGQTFDRIREIHPQMPVLLSSGYAINGKTTEIMRSGCNGFIQKPYNIAKISQIIRVVLAEVKS